MNLFPFVYGATYENDYGIIYGPYIPEVSKEKFIEIIRNGLDSLLGEFNKLSIKDLTWLNCCFSGVQLSGVFCSQQYITEKIERDKWGRDLFCFLGYLSDKQLKQPIPNEINLFSCLYKYIEKRGMINNPKFINDTQNIKYERIGNNIQIIHPLLGINVNLEVNYSKNDFDLKKDHNIYPISFNQYIWNNLLMEYLPNQDFSLCLNVKKKAIAINFIESGLFTVVTCVEIDQPLSLSFKEEVTKKNKKTEDINLSLSKDFENEEILNSKKGIIDFIIKSLYELPIEIVIKIYRLIKRIMGNPSNDNEINSIDEIKRTMPDINKNLDSRIDKFEKKLPRDKRRDKNT